MRFVRPPPYPTVPATALETQSWHIDERGTFQVVRGTPQILRQVDSEWLGLKNDDSDESTHWNFHTLGQGCPERFVVQDHDERNVAIWLDHSCLVSRDAYRLDFFKIRPDSQRRGLGQFVFGLIGLRAKEIGASRIVFQSLKNPQALSFYKNKLGATDCADWRGREGLPNLQINQDVLTSLREQLDGYRLKQVPT